MSDDEVPPWRWPEERWRSSVNRVRAGAPLRPKWPNGARCAVALSFDSDHETNELRDGGTSIGRLSWGQYGARVGAPRILALLKKYDVRASFYVPAVSAMLYPDEQRRIIAEGHEIGLHGWIHELNSTLDYTSERDLMFAAADALEGVTGVRPIGIRTPSWDFSPHTMKCIEELGLTYDSSLMADEDCYELVHEGRPTGIVEIPVEWIRDDAPYFSMHRMLSLRPYTPPEGVFDIFKRELDGALEAGGLFQLTMHPHIITPRSRIWIVEDLIAYAQSRGAWFATHGEVARLAKALIPKN